MCKNLEINELINNISGLGKNKMHIWKMNTREEEKTPSQKNVGIPKCGQWF